MTHFKLKESIGWGKVSILYASTQKKNFRFRKSKFKLRWICRLKQSVSDQKKYESKKLLLDTLTNVCLASRHRIHQNLSRQSKSRLSKIENKIFKLSLKNSFSPLHLRQREGSQNNNFFLFSKWNTYWKPSSNDGLNYWQMAKLVFTLFPFELTTVFIGWLFLTVVQLFRRDGLMLASQTPLDQSQKNREKKTAALTLERFRISDTKSAKSNAGFV